MIYTLTLNPAIDLFIRLKSLTPNIVNRTEYEEYQENGKGVNISRVLKLLNINSTALGFIGGFSGEYIKEKLESSNIDTKFIKVDGITRINVFLNGNEEYKIVNKGPYISKDNQDKLLIELNNLKENDFLFVCGSLPQGIDPIYFEEIFKICNHKKIKLIIDTSYKEILDYLKYGVYLIKPNEDELKDFFNINHDLNEEELIFYGKKLLKLGCEKVLISRGDKGAIYLDENMVLLGNAPKGKVINTACAGDTLLASFMSKIFQKINLKDALKFSIGAGSSTAFTEGITDFKNIHILEKEIKIIEFNEGV